MWYVPLLSLLLVSQAFARLGDTREQAEARYGLPKSEKPPKGGSPLLEGSRELTFVFEGWKIRCALLPAKDGQEYIVCEEYTHHDGIPTIKHFERDAILHAESNGLEWKPESAALSLNPLKTFFKGMLGGPTYVRSDGAIAVHSQNRFPLRLQLPQAQAWEAEMARIADEKARAQAGRILQPGDIPARQPAASPATPPRRAEPPIQPRQSSQSAPASLPVTPVKAMPSAPKKSSTWFMMALAGLFVVGVGRAAIRPRRRASKAKKPVRVSAEEPSDWIPRAEPKTVKDLSWDEFELLVGEIYRRQGYQAELSAGTGADGGIDLLLRKEGERALVQCKSWKAWKVNVSEIREFFGVLISEQASRGIFVTTGTFTRDALDFAAGKPIEMIDGTTLDELIRRAKTAENDDLLNVDLWAPLFVSASKVTIPACPFCKSTMVKRTGGKGSFWGCPTYPRCRGKREMRKHVGV